MMTMTCQCRFHRFALQLQVALAELLQTQMQTSTLPLSTIRHWSCPRPTYPHAPVAVRLLPMHLLILPTRATRIPLHALLGLLRACYRYQHRRLRCVDVTHMTRFIQRCSHRTFPNLRRHPPRVSLPSRGLSWATASTSERDDSTALHCTR